jgi:hypothetical protein
MRDETAWPWLCWAARRKLRWLVIAVAKRYSQLETTLQQRCEGCSCAVAVDKIHDLQPLRFALRPFRPFRPWVLDDAMLCMGIRSFDAVARLRSLEMHGRVADVVCCSETGPRQELSQSTGAATTLLDRLEDGEVQRR